MSRAVQGFASPRIPEIGDFGPGPAHWREPWVRYGAGLQAIVVHLRAASMRSLRRAVAWVHETFGRSACS